MPRDLFGNVTRPSISISNRKWYTVPVSLISHALVIAALLIVPIIAAPLLPGVLNNEVLTPFISVVPPTPPPPPAETAAPRPQPIEGGISVIAPTGIAPETPQPEAGFEQPVSTGTILGAVDNSISPPPPPVKVAPPEPLRVGGIVRQPLKVHDVSPVYPTIAQAARVQGIVIIEATIGEDGRVINARILRSVPLLDQAALDAVQQWQYTPTTLNGVHVPVIMTVTVNFTLR